MKFSGVVVIGIAYQHLQRLRQGATDQADLVIAGKNGDHGFDEVLLGDGDVNCRNLGKSQERNANDKSAIAQFLSAWQE